MLLWLVRAKHDYYENKCDKNLREFICHSITKAKKRIKIPRFSYFRADGALGPLGRLPKTAGPPMGPATLRLTNPLKLCWVCVWFCVRSLSLVSCCVVAPSAFVVFFFALFLSLYQYLYLYIYIFFFFSLSLFQALGKHKPFRPWCFP